jgi:hypothetical protein
LSHRLSLVAEGLVPMDARIAKSALTASALWAVVLAQLGTLLRPASSTSVGPIATGLSSIPPGRQGSPLVRRRVDPAYLDSAASYRPRCRPAVSLGVAGFARGVIHGCFSADYDTNYYTHQPWV